MLASGKGISKDHDEGQRERGREGERRKLRKASDR